MNKGLKMNTEKTGSEVLTQEQDSQVEQTVSGSSPEKSDTGVEQEKQQADGYVEEWACHFGTCQDRKRGQRNLQFNEGMSDVAEDVGSCLAALSVMAETMTTQAWRGKIADGFCTLTALICEAASKTLNALDKECKSIERENTNLRKVRKQEYAEKTPTIFGDDIEAMFGKYRKLYGEYGYQAFCSIGMILVDCLAAEDRERFVSLIVNGASPKQIKEQIGTIDIKAAQSAIHSNHSE